MYLIFGLAAGLAGAWYFGPGGLLLGMLLGVLGAEVVKLRGRVKTLEKTVELNSLSDKVAAAAEVARPAPEHPRAGPQKTEDKRVRQLYVVPPRTEDDGTPADDSTAADRLQASCNRIAGQLRGKIGQFFTTGNLVLKIGVIVIFFGMAFLLKYAAQRNMIPIELRLAGVAICGIAALCIGWLMRRTRSGYGLVLQGGGVGMLYLVLFAAARFYDFLPMVYALVLMICLVALTGALAVLQEARSLALFGIVGGFLAPVLMAEGGGSHIVLFSYYALLNAGILGIAWFKSWRELNLVGFLFTFTIGTLWGAMAYRPENLVSTEFFLILFFVFYVCISVLYAHRQPVSLRGFIDGPLVFGLPLIVSGLQYYLVKDIPYAMAFSVLLCGLFYMCLAWIFWRRMSHSLHLICETFLALGVVFGSLAIPLALDQYWSSSIWAVEGAGMVWVGCRQQRWLARHFGILLQLAAAVIFLDSVWYPFVALPFANRYFLGCLLLALGALFSSYCLDRYKEELKSWEHFFTLPLLLLGLLWWYYGGFRESSRHMQHIGMKNGFLLYCCLSSIVMGMTVRKLAWPRLGLAMYVQLPVMVLFLVLGYVDFSASNHFFMKWGMVAWPVALVIQYRILYAFGDDWTRQYRLAYHLGTMWLLVLLLCYEADWAMRQWAGMAGVWSFVCWSVIPSVVLLVLLHLGRGNSWPVGRYASLYLGLGGVLPALLLAGWMIAACAVAGNPLPLPYIPLINPLELAGLLLLGTLLLWMRHRQRHQYVLKYLPERYTLWGVGALFFCWINSVVARTVHFYAGIPYSFYSLYHSVIFQAAVAALWGVGSLALTIWAAHRKSRLLWGIGATLLGMVVLKLFVVDLSGSGTIARIVSFLVVGGLMLLIGYFSPLPPKTGDQVQ